MSVRNIFQVDSRGLDIDELCKRHDSPDIDRVMQHWQNTHSPMVYWTRQTVQKIQTHKTNKDDDLLREVINKDYIYGMPFKYGLPKTEVEKVCRQMYQKDVVKLTLQIIEPKTTQIHKYLTTSFGEMLGVIGKYKLQFFIENLRHRATCYFGRWHYRTLPGSQHCKLGRGMLLCL